MRMKRIFAGLSPALSLRMFLLTALPFMFTMPLTMSVFGSTPIGQSILTGVISGILFGCIMTLVFARMHMRGVRRVKADAARQDLDLHQKRTLKIDLPATDALELMRRALESLPNAAIDSVDMVQGKIRGRGAISWRSWGEKIAIDVVPDAAHGSIVTIDSRPAMPYTVVDYGQNLSNVEQITRYVSSYPGSSSTE